MATQPPIVFTHHAREKMADRGASEEEVIQTIREGERERAALGRFLYRMNFTFAALWQGRPYRIKQVVGIVAEEPQRLVVVTVYVFYFG